MQTTPAILLPSSWMQLMKRIMLLKTILEGMLDISEQINEVDSFC